jgi:translocation and assembly module TamA
MSRRAAALALLAPLVMLASGCAGLPRAAAPGTSGASGTPAAPSAPSATAANAAAVPMQVIVQAPAPLRALLERHLDLVRLTQLPGTEVSDSEWKRLIEAAPLQVRELLQTEGYFAPQMEVAREGAADAAGAVVRLTVAPGPRATVTRLTLQAEGALEREAGADMAYARGVLDTWRRNWALPPGSEFRNEAWSEAKATALAQLRAAGYAAATWAGTAAEVDPQRHEVRLFLVVDSGPLFRHGRLQVEGLARHDLATVGHIAALSAGEPLTETRLLDFQERLRASGLFESVDVTLDTDPAQADAARVWVRLREAPLQVYTVGVGVSANTGPRASVEHLYRRVLGRALTARNKFELGDQRQAWEGEVATHPGPGLYRNLLGGAVENLDVDADAVLSQRLRLGRSQETQRLERLYFIEAERSRRTVPGQPRERTLALSLNYHGVWRRLDNPVLPTEGFTLAAQGGAGHSSSNAAENGPFTRAYGRLTVYAPLGRHWFAQARVEAGQVVARQGVRAPESQLFRAGGDDSVRGYGFRTLGPQTNGVVGSGRALATASLELARPFSTRMPSLWGAVFVDAGNAASSFSELSPALGTGVGVRWRSPVGPLRVDWAYGREVRRSRLHFSVGIAF